MSAAPGRRSTLPGFGLTMGLTLTWLSVIILMPLAGLFLKTLGDVSAEFVHVELRSVDDEIGYRSNGAQVTAFGFEG